MDAWSLCVKQATMSLERHVQQASAAGGLARTTWLRVMEKAAPFWAILLGGSGRAHPAAG